MAMKELKTFNVAPGSEEETIRLWRSFGWELVGAPQEIRTNDSQVFTGQDSDGTKYFETTTGVHYVKLTFERDPARPNYEELKSLEEQYCAIEEPTIWEQPRFITKLWLILIGAGLVLYVVPGIILLVIHIIKYVNDTKLWNSAFAKYRTEMASYNARREEILKKAQALV